MRRINAGINALEEGEGGRDYNESFVSPTIEPRSLQGFIILALMLLSG